MSSGLSGGGGSGGSGYVELPGRHGGLKGRLAFGLVSLVRKRPQRRETTRGKDMNKKED